MTRIHGLVGAVALVAAWGLTACGSTSRSCPSGDAACSEAADGSDGVGDASSSADQGGSGAGASGGAPDDTAHATGSGATGAGASGSGSTASVTSGGSGGAGGSGGTGTVGSGGSGASGGTGSLPDRTPGHFDCGEADVATPLVRLTNIQYDNTVFDLLGVETLDAFDGSRPSFILANDPSDSITDLGWEAYHMVADAIAEQVMEGPLATNFITCDPMQAGCLSETIATFGRKAFRRPLSDAERADYERLIPDDLMDAADTTARTILATMLASPSFVWRLEQGGLSEAALTSYEVASRLAYFLWNGPPDAELAAAADADELQTEEQLTAQALRMLDDPYLTSQPECVDCHARYINPIGFVLETYDAVGAWQTVDPRGGTIDPVADVFFGDHLVTVETSLELMQTIAESTFAQRNYADEVVAYAFSRAPNARDACLADALTQSMAQHISLQELWLAVVRSDEFRIRGVASD